MFLGGLLAPGSTSSQGPEENNHSTKLSQQIPSRSLKHTVAFVKLLQHMNIHSQLSKREANIAIELSLGTMGVPSVNEDLVVISLEFVPLCQDDDSMRTITSLLCTLGEDQLIPWRIMAVQWSTTSVECTSVIDVIVRFHQIISGVHLRSLYWDNRTPKQIFCGCIEIVLS